MKVGDKIKITKDYNGLRTNDILIINRIEKHGMWVKFEDEPIEYALDFNLWSKVFMFHEMFDDEDLLISSTVTKPYGAAWQYDQLTTPTSSIDPNYNKQPDDKPYIDLDYEDYECWQPNFNK